MPPGPLETFHPIVADWFRTTVGQPTDVQAAAWPAIRSGTDTLIAAPTGSGKTFAAFLTCIDQLFQQACARELRDETQVLYVSPLKALSNDIQKNLLKPLADIGEAVLAAGQLVPELRVAVRTGDTPMSERQQMLRRPPHILVTTPESLYILLTADKSRALLKTVRTVIVDEIHAVAATKRGAHLALSLERLDALAIAKPIRIGLSATQRPIETVARFLSGAGATPTVIDVGHRRTLDLGVEVPKDELSAVATSSIWSDLYDRLAELIRAHRSTLVFVNTRRLAERVSHHLEERLRDLGPEAVAAHHGSLSRALRLSAESRLKQGVTRVVVATASLELGIDVGTIDLVCQIGSPRAIATGLQRIGRAGHWVRAVPKGRLFATTRDELLECAALVRAIRAGTLDRIEVPPEPLDILAQQLVASAASQAWEEDEAYAMVRRAYPYRDLSRASFDAVLRMLADGIATSRGRGYAYLHHDRINRRFKGRRGARLAAITSGGAIPDTANYAVVAEPEGTVVGSVDEDFAVESLAGDIMLLGNTSWRIRGVERGTVRVEDANGAPPNIPFWRGEAPARTAELSAEVAALRQAIAAHTTAGPSTLSWLMRECALDARGAKQAIEYVLAGQAVLGAVPTQETVIAERFFDESGGMQLVVHAPFGGRINKAWGLALRKRFCVTFDFELQAAATDEGLVISLGEKHSFPLASVFEYLQPDTLHDVLTPAVLAAPMFTTRWRWNAMRSLALLRFAKGKKVPPQIQRMKAEDLLAAIFPDAIACQDNFRGARVERQVPDHPLAHETMRDCFTEAMDVDGLASVLRRMQGGTIRCVAVETPVPSVFAHEILNANPYAFLDDAPLEERRARAVEMRRTLPADLAAGVGALDAGAIEEVTREVWPVVRDADELHDALLTLVWVPQAEAEAWAAFVPPLVAAGRLVVRQHRDDASGRVYEGWMAQEQAALASGLFEQAEEAPTQTLVQGWMESLGPTTAAALGARLGIATLRVTAALLALEATGQVIRGQMTPQGTRQTSAAEIGDRPDEVEWCHRRVLARIHRLTIGRLRRDIEPVSSAEFMRFLLHWQHVAPGARLHGEAGLLEVITQLAGYEAAASAWEPHLFRARVSGYDPRWLDQLCLSGAVSWGRLSPRTSTVPLGAPAKAIVPTSVAPIGLFPREDAAWLLAACRGEGGARAGAGANVLTLSSPAQAIRQALSQRGACFFADLVAATGLLPSDVEQGLWELVAAGVVTADGFDNLRALMDPHRRRAEGRHRQRRPRHSAGRWALLHADASPALAERDAATRVAQQLLRRYGVVFRDLVRRESLVTSWRDLLVSLRRMELQGDVRGGRFVAGFVGEQYALPEAVEALRSLRKGAASAVPLSELRLSAADPLNLTGILVPGDRIPAIASHMVVFRNGLPLAQPATAEPALLIPGDDASAHRSRRIVIAPQ